MVDMTAIGVVATSLNTLMNMAKSMKDVHDATLLDGKVFELQRAILSTQESVFAANQERATLIERVGSLEKEISDLNKWEAEKLNYELREMDPIGVFAYAYKPGPNSPKPMHFLCANCYEQGQKSLLQATAHTARGKRVHSCPRCEREFAFGGAPIQRAQFTSEYNPFRDPGRD